jgi:hypothetical protein
MHTSYKSCLLSKGQDCSTHLLDPDDPNVLVLDGNNVDFCRAYGTRTVKIAESAAKLEGWKRDGGVICNPGF